KPLVIRSAFGDLQAFDLRVGETATQRRQRLSSHPSFSTSLAAQVKSLLLGFKYWLDEPFYAVQESRLAEERKRIKPNEGAEYEMTFWSENHQILFATAEYLAGQMWPDALFQPGRNYRSNPDTRAQGDIDGGERMRRSRPRILQWLSDRLRF